MLQSWSTLYLFLLFQGSPLCCLKSDYLIFSYSFSKTDPLSTVAATTSGASAGQHNHPTCSPTCPPDLWSISFRSLWGWTVTQVLDPATNHSLLLFEDFTGEVPPGLGPAPPVPPLTTSMVWELQANPPRRVDWQSVYFQFPAHVFPPFLLPLNPELSILRNPATSGSIPDPILTTGYPPVDSPQSSDFILVFIFQFA